MVIAETSTEYVHIPVAATSNGQPVTLTTPPRVAFLLTDDNPDAEDWLDAEWVDGSARILIGPEGGAIILSATSYWAWVTWEAGDETPVYKSGRIKVY